MAPKKNDEGLMEIFIPKGFANEDPNFYVSVNGVNYVLPKGKKSMVPTHIGEEIKRSQRAQQRLEELEERLQNVNEDVNK